MELPFLSGKVSVSNASGVRYRSTLDLAAVPGFDTYSVVSTPGAIFTIEHGIDFGGGNTEMIPCGVYEAASGAVDLGNGKVNISLVDLWQRIERSHFYSSR